MKLIYAFLAAALVTGIGIIFTVLLIQESHRRRSGVVGTAATTVQS